MKILLPLSALLLVGPLGRMPIGQPGEIDPIQRKCPNAALKSHMSSTHSILEFDDKDVYLLF
jgi:hypothetical protein